MPHRYALSQAHMPFCPSAVIDSLALVMGITAYINPQGMKFSAV